MTEVSDTLRAARKLIEKPENWCKGDFARNSSGEPVPDESADACAWCVAGALYCRSVDAVSAGRAFMALHRSLPNGFLCAPNFNDHPDTTHPMVLDLFDRAIAMEEAG